MQKKQTDEYAIPVVMTDEDRFQAFSLKSQEMTPKCFGAFKKDVELCTRWCACGFDCVDKYDQGVRARLNEGRPDEGFFKARVTTPSCQKETDRLQRAVKDAQRPINAAMINKMELSECIANIRRVPVGEVRYGRKVRNFVSTEFVYLDSSKMCLFALRPSLGPRRAPERQLCKVAEIRGRRQLSSDCLEVLSQELVNDNVVLTVKAINEDRKVFGHSFKLFIKISSALDSGKVPMDDRGAL